MEFDFNLEPSFAATPTPGDLQRQQAAGTEIERATIDEPEAGTWLGRRFDTLYKGFQTNLTSDILSLREEAEQMGVDPALQPDPTYTIDRLKADLKIATEEHGIHPTFLETLESAHSPGHMKYLIARAKERQQLYQELQSEGAEGIAALLIGTLLDPSNLITLPLGVGVGSAILRAGKAARQVGKAGIGTATGLTAFAGGAAAEGAAITAVQDAVNVSPITDTDYLYAAGLAGLFGGALGLASIRPLGITKINRQIEHARKRLVVRGGGRVAEIGKKEAEALRNEPTHLPSDRAQKIYQSDKIEVETPPPPADTPPGSSEITTPPSDTPSASPAAPVKFEVPNPLKPDESIEVTVGSQQAERPPTEAPTLRPLEDNPKDLENPRYVASYEGPDGSVYKLMVAPGPASSPVGGPYVAFKKAPGETKFVKFSNQPLESIEDFRAQVLGREAGEVELVPQVKMSDGAAKAHYGDEAAPEGFITGTVKDGVLTIDQSVLAKKHRGKGKGLDLYRALIDAAHARGFQVRSSPTLSDDAKKLYERLDYPVAKLNNGAYQVLSKDSPESLLQRAVDDLPANFADIEDFYAIHKGTEPDLTDDEILRASYFMEAGADVDTAIKLAKRNAQKTPDTPQMSRELVTTATKNLPRKEAQLEVIKGYGIDNIDDGAGGGGGSPPGTDLTTTPDGGGGQGARTHYSGFMGFLNLTRFDRHGLATGQRASPLGRVVGEALMNNPVGKPGHAPTNIAAITDAQQQGKQWINQYAQVHKPSLDEFMAANGYSTLQRGHARRDFAHEVYLYVTGVNTEPSPPVQRAGDAMRAGYAEILKKMKDPGVEPGTARPIPGATDVPEDPFYATRVWDFAKIRNATEEFTEGPIIDLLQDGFMRASPQLTNDEAQRLATYFYRSIHRRAAGLHDEWSYAFGQGNYLQFRRLLENETNFTPDEIADLLSRMTITQPESPHPNLRRRAMIDINARVDLTNYRGEPVTLRLYDLLDTNSVAQFAGYARRSAGRVALARMQIRHPITGALIQNGIIDDGEFEAIKRSIRQYHSDFGTLDQAPRGGGAPEDRTLQNLLIDRIGELENLQFVYDRVLGRPDPNQMKDYAYALRQLRKYMSARLMGMVGIAQAGETAFPVAHLGLRAALKKMPALRRITGPEGRTMLEDPIFHELEMIGIGGERVHGFFWNTIDELGDLPFENPQMSNRFWRRLEEFNNSAERMVYEASGMSFLQQQQQRWVGHIFVNWFAQNADSITPAQMKRLASLNIGEEMLERIQAQVKKHSHVDKSSMFGNKIRRLNLQEWDDLQARHHLERGAFKAANKFIQTNDPSVSAWFMSKPIMQTILQFRSFPLTAYANQFLYNVHMGDTRSAMAFISTMVWASAMRALQVHIKAAGRTDGQRYRERYLSTEELAKAGFERAGWASILPGVIDQANIWTGGEALFNARTSGDPTGLFAGSPLVSASRNLHQGLVGIRREATGGPGFAQTEARNLLGLLPLSNLIGIQNGINLLVSPLPERAPYRYGK